MNRTDEDNFNKAFRDRFNDFETRDVSEHNWNAIKNGIPQKRSFLKRNWKKSSLLSLLLLITTCLYRSEKFGNRGQNLEANNGEKIIIGSQQLSNYNQQPTTNNKSTHNYPNATTLSGVRNQPSASNLQEKLIADNQQLSTNNYQPSTIDRQLSTSNYQLTTKSTTHNLDNANSTRSFHEENAAPLADINAVSGSDAKKKSVDGMSDHVFSSKQIDLPAPVKESKKKEPLEQIIETLKFQDVVSFLPTGTANNVKYSKQIYAAPNYDVSVPIATKKQIPTSLYFSIEPLYSFFSFSPNTADKTLLTNFVTPSSLSIDRLGFSSGAGFSFQLAKHFQMQLGINFAGIPKTISYSVQSIVPDSFKINTKTAFSVSLDPVYATNTTVEKSTYYLLGINPTFQYNFRNTGLGYFAAVGARSNSLLNDLKNNSICFDVSVGYQQKLNAQFNWRVAPKFTYYLPNKSSFSTPALFANPYTVGVEFMFVKR